MFASEGEGLCRVVYLTDWITESQMVRRGTWTLDRMRFQRRIEETDQKIGWIFLKQQKSNKG
jgi:hypothetical protein